MSIALQLLINIAIPTALLSLVAAGFSIFLSVSRVQHLTIGASVGAAGYALYAVLAAGAGFSLGLLAALAASVGVGLFANAVIYERLQGRRWFSEATALISSVILLIGLQSVLLLLFGSQPHRISIEIFYRRFVIGGASITLIELIILPLALLLLCGFWLFLKYSRLGVAIRAVSDNPEVSEVIGINTRRIRYITMVIISLLAGVAGALIAIEYNLEPYASSVQAVAAYGRTIIGGLGSIPGVLLASIIIDGATNVGAYFFSSSYKEVIPFVFVFLFLLLRPHGLFGTKRN